MFPLLGAKILLKTKKKKANKQWGGQNDCQTRDITVPLHSFTYSRI